MNYIRLVYRAITACILTILTGREHSPRVKLPPWRVQSPPMKFDTGVDGGWKDMTEGLRSTGYNLYTECPGGSRQKIPVNICSTHGNDPEVELKRNSEMAEKIKSRVRLPASVEQRINSAKHRSKFRGVQLA